AQQINQSERIHPDTVWQNYLTSIGRQIVEVSDRQDIEYHFTVIESDQINAFAAPGGYIYFYTGLLKLMDSEAELASVMAHEISHVVARHGVKRLQAAMGVTLAYELIFGGEEQSEALNAAIGIGLGLASAGYSRANEREADEYGMTYMIRAGYHPEGMVSMFEKLADAGGGGDRDVFEAMAASHPETQERIHNAQERISGMQLPGDLTYGRDTYQRMLQRLSPGS
ncbi:M48 family metalloprotease, partial [candidate division GN15 bacterium]|nr:M48 family metalloprotease [candidate division GN15 bacterium]